MGVMVRIPTPLRRLTNGQDRATVEDGSLREIISSLEEQFPGMKERLCDDQGELRSFVNMYVNGEDIRFLNGLDTSTKAGDEVSVVPAVAGG